MLNRKTSSNITAITKLHDHLKSSSQQLPFVVQVASVDERIMRVRLQHILGFISLVAVYSSTEMCETDKKDMFYAKLDSVTDQCPSETHSLS